MHSILKPSILKPSRGAIAFVLLGIAALPGLASASVVTSATAIADLGVLDVIGDVTVTYLFDTDNTTQTTATSGNAVASALQTPSTNIAEPFFFERQDGQSQAESYPNTGGRRSTAYAQLANLGTVLMQNNSPTDPAAVTISWSYNLEAIQRVTGAPAFADAFAFAEVLLFDDNFDFDLSESVQALYDGAEAFSLADAGEVTLFVPANDSNRLSIRINTETNAEFVAAPVPTTPLLLGIGLVGMHRVRRVARGGKRSGRRDPQAARASWIIS